MNAYYLHRPDGTQTTAAACGTCHGIHLSIETAERCCLCTFCKTLLGNNETGIAGIHTQCRNTRDQQSEERAFALAEPVTDYDGPLFCEAAGSGSFGDGYFADLDELYESLEDIPVDSWPEFAFCCTGTQFRIDPDHVLEAATENMFEDAYDHLDHKEFFVRAVEVFNELNKSVISYEPDYKHKIAILPVNPDRCPYDHSTLTLYGDPCPLCSVVEGSDMK